MVGFVQVVALVQVATVAAAIVVVKRRYSSDVKAIVTKADQPLKSSGSNGSKSCSSSGGGRW